MNGKFMKNKDIIAHCMKPDPRPDVLAYAIAHQMVESAVKVEYIKQEEAEGAEEPGQEDGPADPAPAAAPAGTDDPFESTEDDEDSEDVEDDGSGEVALKQLMELNVFLDSVAPEDPEDMDVVDRVKQAIGKAPEKPKVEGMEESFLVVPAPVLASMLSVMMRVQYNDQRFHGAPTVMVAGSEKWEFSWREGTVVCSVYKNWHDVQRANEELVTINQRIGEAARDEMGKRGLHDRALEQQRAKAVTKPGRVISHVEVTVKGKKVMKPVYTNDVTVESRKADGLEKRYKEIAEDLTKAKAALEELRETRAWAKRTIEESVPDDYTFGLSDLASGRVRVGDVW